MSTFSMRNPGDVVFVGYTEKISSDVVKHVHGPVSVSWASLSVEHIKGVELPTVKEVYRFASLNQSFYASTVHSSWIEAVDYVNSEYNRLTAKKR